MGAHASGSSVDPTIGGRLGDRSGIGGTGERLTCATGEWLRGIPSRRALPTTLFFDTCNSRPTSRADAPSAILSRIVAIIASVHSAMSLLPQRGLHLLADFAHDREQIRTWKCPWCAPHRIHVRRHCLPIRRPHRRMASHSRTISSLGHFHTHCSPRSLSSFLSLSISASRKAQRAAFHSRKAR